MSIKPEEIRRSGATSLPCPPPKSTLYPCRDLLQEKDPYILSYLFPRGLLSTFPYVSAPPHKQNSLSGPRPRRSLLRLRRGQGQAGVRTVEPINAVSLGEKAWRRMIL